MTHQIIDDIVAKFKESLNDLLRQQHHDARELNQREMLVLTHLVIYVETRLEEYHRATLEKFIERLGSSEEE